MKRFSPLLILHFVCLALFGDLKVFATPPSHFDYVRMDDGSISIRRFRGNDPVVDVPMTIDGFAVTEIYNSAFANATGVVSVTLPITVTKILDNAFIGCRSLTNIVLPDRLAKMGGGLFWGCSNLPSVVIPSQIKTIGEGMFYDCLEITNVTVSHHDNPVEVEMYAFYGCEKLRSVQSPLGIRSLGDDCFRGCSELSHMDLHPSLVAVGSRAFMGCKSLREFEIPDPVSRIGNSAFLGCTGLARIFIPENVTALGERCFQFCSGLTNARVGSGVRDIPRWMFGSCVGLRHVTLGRGIVGVGNWSFLECTNLKTISFEGNRPEVVENDAFSGTSSLIYFLPTAKGWTSEVAGLMARSWNPRVTYVSGSNLGTAPFRIRVTGADDVLFAVEASSDFEAWNRMAVLSLTNGLAEYVDENGASEMRRFFRLRFP